MASLKLGFSVFGILTFAALSSSLTVPEFFSLDGETDSKPLPVAHNLAEAIQNADQILDGFMKRLAIPSMVFGISVRNQTLHRSAKGVIDLENDVPANINAMYRMASVTKTFVSTIIGTLVDSGKLKYEDSIYKYLPANRFLPKFFNGKQVDITVGQVLSHMAGFHESNVTDYFKINNPATSLDSIGPLRFEPLYFQPGTDWAYSNYGYQLLGAIIEHIVGKPFSVAMDEFIHKVLKLSDGSTIETPNTILHHHPRPKYYKEDNTTKATIGVGVFDDALFSAGIQAAGGLLSNVDDLLKYGNLLVDIYHGRPNAIMKNETLAQIWTRRSSNAPNFPTLLRSTTDYGYGWMITHIPESINPTLKHRNAYWHAGGLTGASTFLVVYPEEEIVAVTMVNKGFIPGLEFLCVSIVEIMADFASKNSA